MDCNQNILINSTLISLVGFSFTMNGDAKPTVAFNTTKGEEWSSNNDNIKVLRKILSYQFHFRW